MDNKKKWFYHTFFHKNKFFKIIIAVCVSLLIVSGFVFYRLMNYPSNYKTKIFYEVSANTGGPHNSYWDAVKQGMDRASLDFNVDLNFISLTSADYAEEQNTQIQKEIENGTQALIIAPSCDYDLLSQSISQASKKSVIMLIESESENDVTSVSADNEFLGKKLGEAIRYREQTDLDSAKSDSTTLNSTASDSSSLAAVILSNSGAAYEKKRMQGLLEEFQELDILNIPNGRTMEYEIRQYVLIHQPRILIALDAQALLAAASVIEEKKNRPVLYGIDSMSSIVTYLEKHVIQCVVVPKLNAYNMGYLSVKAVVDALQGKQQEKIIQADCVVITPATIYTSEHQRILFPFVK
jgi:ribose transport system substrate-binding protein